MEFWNFTNAGSEIVELRIEGDIIDDGSAWLYEWFDEPHTAPNKFRQQLKEHDGKELHVIVDTYGGSVFAGTSIYSDLKSRKGKTIGIVHSKAMSAGTIILMGCDEIRVSPTAILMIHDPLTGIYGGISDFEKALEVLNTIKDAILNAYVDKTGLNRNSLSAMMTDETWFDANQAVEKGFADSIISTDLDVKNSFSAERMRVINDANSVEHIKRYTKMLNKKETEGRQKELMLYLDAM